jgi:hypothetical protein
MVKTIYGWVSYLKCIALMKVKDAGIVLNLINVKMIAKNKLLIENKILTDRLSQFEDEIKVLKHKLDVIYNNNLEFKKKLKSIAYQKTLNS